MSSTDTNTLDMISKEAYRLFPRCSISPKAILSPGELHGIDIRTLEDLDIEFGQYVIILMGNHGWEPCFSERQEPFENQSSMRRIDFRKESISS